MKKAFVVILLHLSMQLLAQTNTLDSLEKVLLSKSDDESKDSVFFNPFRKYVYYKPDSAVFYTQRELVLAQRLNLPLLESRSLCRYGYILGLLGNYPQGIEYLLRGVKMAEQLKDTTGLDWDYNFLMEIYTHQGDLKQVAFYINKEKYILTNEPDYSREISHSMGVLHRNLNNLDSALYYENKALEEDIKISGKIERGIIPITLGTIYLKRNSFDSALRYFNIALPLAIQGSYNKDLIQVYNGIAEVFLKTAQKDSCIYYAYEALGLRSTNASPLGILNTYNILYRSYKQRGKADSAIKYLEQTIILKDSLFNQQEERQVQYLAFNEQLRQQQEESAKAKYQNKMRLYAALAGFVIVIIIAAILWRNNLHKKKAYTLIEKQKKETDLHRMTAESALADLKATQSQLIQSEKMASLGELTAGIAHEIQNPLNFVNNFSEVNAELINEMKQEIDKGNTEEVKGLANDIEENEKKIIHHGKRADAIVKGMLQHSSASTGQKEPTDINALANECLRLCYHGFKAKDKSFNITMQTNLDECIEKINVVPQDIAKALLNLINNAFYSLNEKQKKLGIAFAPSFSVSTKKINGRVEVKVKDNGVGIPQKVLDKIYQPFFTTKPTGQGTGLGLSLAYDIIKAHGGEIKVETKEKEGAEFKITLPIN